MVPVTVKLSVARVATVLPAELPPNNVRFFTVVMLSTDIVPCSESVLPVAVATNAVALSVDKVPDPVPVWMISVALSTVTLLDTPELANAPLMTRLPAHAGVAAIRAATKVAIPRYIRFPFRVLIPFLVRFIAVPLCIEGVNEQQRRISIKVCPCFTQVIAQPNTPSSRGSIW